MREEVPARHHMFIVEGDLSRCREILAPLGLGSARRQGDVWERESDVLTVELVHEAQTAATFTAAGSAHFIILAADRIGAQAQQALLKLAEEPPVNTTIALAVPSANLCLPTLRSRAVVVRASGAQRRATTFREGEGLARRFWEATIEERLALAQEIAKRDDAANAARACLLRLGARAREWPPQHQRALRSALMWLDAPAPHIKAIMEYCALIAPASPTDSEHCDSRERLVS
ncbi:hypothetical protein D6792_01765 [Candidatus Parcubacteria bacterium]|nr:MAG: hypothetical protein D6792_01765 [Candidatus Parcubacteria bacterium]